MSTNSLNIKHSNKFEFGKTTKNNTIFASVIRTLVTWQDRASMRYKLAEMSKENLSDIGLSHFDLNKEIQKPFWQN